MNDIVHGADNEDYTNKLYVESKDILRNGSFNLRRFITNSQTLQERIDKDDDVLYKDTKYLENFEKTYTKSTLGRTQRMQSGGQKVLGVRWDVFSDQFVFDFDDIPHIAQELDPTKRNIVSIVGRFYDPLNFMSPIIL